MLEDAPRAPVERSAPWQEAVAWLRSFADNVRDRPARAAMAAVAICAVGVALWWLLRPPPAVAPETVLPIASTGVPPAHEGAPDAPGAATQALATASPTAPPATVAVHIAGAVARPGVLWLPEGSRVVDAIAAAGGAAADADTDRVNLAAPLGDGAWIHVPRVGEPTASPPAGASGPAGERSGAPVDLNTASAEQLVELPGIGPATAAAIVEHRTTHGPFRSVESLADVPGIGQAKLERLRPLVRV